jgi:hypothetical protein
MKKMRIASLCLALIMVSASCAKKAEKTTASGAPAEPPRTKNAVVMAGEYICPDFNLTIAAGWTATLETDGKVEVLPVDEPGPGLYFRFERNAAGTAEEAINAVIAAEKGSPMGTAVLNGVEFKTSSLSGGGAKRTVYIAYRDGVKITITAVGKGEKIERDLKEMLSTVQFR